MRPRVIHLLAVTAALVVGGAGLAGCAGAAVDSAPTPPASSSAPAEPDRSASDREQIMAALNDWPRAWAARDAAGICDLFAPDAVFSYPGGDDRTTEQACAQFSGLVSGTDRTIGYDRPEIEQVLVDGDLAAVRLIWTATITAADGTVLERTREKGVDVLERQSDGRWRITISQAYPLT